MLWTSICQPTGSRSCRPASQLPISKRIKKSRRRGCCYTLQHKQTLRSRFSGGLNEALSRDRIGGHFGMVRRSAIRSAKGNHTECTGNPLYIGAELNEGTRRRNSRRSSWHCHKFQGPHLRLFPQQQYKAV